MKYKLIIILTLFLHSCMITDFKQVSNDFEYKKILSDTLNSYVYRARIKLYDKDFSGLIIIKPKKKKHRIVFLNEIGMKFFDFEISNNSYKTYHIFQAMNKKMLIKLLVNDFRLILMTDINNKSKFLIEKKTGKYAIKPKNVKEYYLFDNNPLLPFSANRYSIIRKNVFLNYEDYTNNIPHHIKIKHKNINFEMNLTFIK